MLQAWRPVEPVYCVYPQAYLDHTRRFLAGFPGRVLYAVKVNDEPRILECLHAAGVRHFDCASLPEIERVKGLFPEAACYFMIPVWPRSAPRLAWERFGVRHFTVDSAEGLAQLGQEVPLEHCVVFVRMAVSHAAAMNDLSTKFGAAPAEVPGLLAAVAELGAEPALAFNVGSAVTDPEAYGFALDTARRVLGDQPVPVRLVDIGGGFPWSYPGFEVPPLQAYFDRIATDFAGLPLAQGGELLTEPGRALAAPGLSAVVEVLQRKGDRLYLNDGMYGIFWELRFKGHERYPVRVWRDARPVAGECRAFTLFGPTCDAFDVLPGRVELPATVCAGDYLEFGHIGAYSLAGRTRFNGHHSDRIVTISGSSAAPPAHP